MFVSDVLNIVKSMALGRDNYTPDQDAMLLTFFNRAHVEMWDAIANLDESYAFIGKKTLTQADSDIITTNRRPIKAGESIFLSDGTSLKKISKKYFIENPNLKQSKSYFYLLNPYTMKLTFEFGNTDTLDVSYAYVPEAQVLSSSDDLDDVYPEKKLQFLLSDGTFYHLSFAEEGTRPTRQQDKALMNWKSFISDAQASLLKSQSFSTEGMW